MLTVCVKPSPLANACPSVSFFALQIWEDRKADRDPLFVVVATGQISLFRCPNPSESPVALKGGPSKIAHPCRAADQVFKSAVGRLFDPPGGQRSPALPWGDTRYIKE